MNEFKVDVLLEQGEDAMDNEEGIWNEEVVIEAENPLSLEEASEVPQEKIEKIRSSDGIQMSLKVKNLSGKGNSDFMVIDNIKSARNCGECSKIISDSANGLFWEVMEFCNTLCLEKYQRRNCSNCTHCKSLVNFTSLGKYCVRFGYELGQFCASTCLQEYKKPLKYCHYCQKPLSGLDKGFLAKIGELDDFRQFCTQFCVDKYSITQGEISSIPIVAICASCNSTKPITIEFLYENVTKLFCDYSCFATFKFVKDILTGACGSCRKHFDSKTLQDNAVYYEQAHHIFCSGNCKYNYVNMSKKLVPCGQCKINKYNFDMIKRLVSGTETIACSLSCLNQIDYSNKGNESYGVTTRRCHFCGKHWRRLHKIVNPNQLEFCSIECGRNFQKEENLKKIEVIKRKVDIVMPVRVPLQRNAGTMCKVTSYDKSIDCKPSTVDKSTQTDPVPDKMALLPIPIPISVPLPVWKYSLPIPMFFPFPLPVPVPIFIATAGKTTAGVLKEIQDIKEKIPADPLEAELIRMAEVAEGEVHPLRNDQMDDVASGEENGIESDAAEILTRELENIVNRICVADSNPSKRLGDPQNPSTKKQKQDDVPKVSNEEESDTETSLQYLLGIKVWNNWVATKTPEFKNQILQLTVDELNYFLCLFVKEVRKPNGSEYSPDTIYYLCLCIQTYLFKNGRSDDIFYDPSYDKFTEALNEAAKDFSLHNNFADRIVTRVREVHLWESNQLGAYSPYVLLNTIMFFNIKYVNLRTISDHMKLSFLNVMRHWNRAFGSGPKNQKESQPSLEKSVMNPVKLYEFYLSKCPDSVKHQADVFYLQPERHCTPDSPVWYSITPLSQSDMEKMYHRIKFVKEIHVALLLNNK